MAIDFDGDNLLITLEVGVTELDIVGDLYKDWKDWMLASPRNRRFPQALLSDGGAPITEVLNQGSYIFLNNAAGWRIKSPEEDITITVTGNLIPIDITVDSFVPTVGEFTVAILGLQPITQGVVPSMQTNIETTVFNSEICVDQANGISGTADVGSDRVGSKRLPSNNLEDAKTLADAENIVKFKIVGDYDTTTETVDLSAGYTFTAPRPSARITLGANINTSNCAFNGLTLTGALDGNNIFEHCTVENVTGFTGEMLHCNLDGDITMGTGTAYLRSCYSAISGVIYPKLLSVASNEVIVRDLIGSIGIGGMTGGTTTIGVVEGRVVFEADCTAGSPYMRGSPYEIIDLSTNITPIDQTEGHKLTDIWVSMDLDTDPTGNIVDKIWAKPVAELTDVDTIGGFISESVLTVGKFLGLK